MNIYRWGKDCDTTVLLEEFEQVLEAYYDLFDQCAEYPDWQRKIRKEMGAVVSFVAKQVEESQHYEMINKSAAYRRYDGEKQLFFK